MKERIIEFLKSENKSSAQFAQEIGVQASSISHIISGRNNPSLDFVMKMLNRYPELSAEWLLFGKGQMLKETKTATLFDPPVYSEIEPPQERVENNAVKGKESLQDAFLKHDEVSGKQHIDDLHNTPTCIIFFFEDNSFIEYTSRRR